MAMPHEKRALEQVPINIRAKALQRDLIDQADDAHDEHGNRADSRARAG